MTETSLTVDLSLLLENHEADAGCRGYLEDLRWPTGPICPRCCGTVISRIKPRKVFDCDGCRYQFSVTAGTMFHDSHLPLPKWFLAIFLICESREGISALELKRLLKVSYKTAWYLSHRIRAAMIEASPRPPTASVEVDDSYLGSGRGPQPGNNIPTDQPADYRGIDDDDTRRETMNHSADEVSGGGVDMQAADGELSRFKRSLVGSFHRVSEKHLNRYLDEFEFRLNNRKNRYLFRDVLLKLLDSKTMPYQELTASP